MNANRRSSPFPHLLTFLLSPFPYPFLSLFGPSSLSLCCSPLLGVLSPARKIWNGTSWEHASGGDTRRRVRYSERGEPKRVGFGWIVGFFVDGAQEECMLPRRLCDLGRRLMLSGGAFLRCGSRWAAGRIGSGAASYGADILYRPAKRWRWAIGGSQALPPSDLA